MATDTRQKQDRSAGQHPVERSTAEEQRRTARREWDRSSFGPLGIMRQGLDEMERWLGHLGRGWLAPGRGFFSQMREPFGDWSPAIEAFQRGSEFVIRADVPGMSRQDLQVEIGEDAVTIHGERKQDRQEEHDGMFWSERSYGSFTRIVPLPPAAITDSAKATFNNGVLEIVMDAPSVEARRGRRLDISGSDEKK